jgi:hypothetical protein
MLFFIICFLCLVWSLTFDVIKVYSAINAKKAGIKKTNHSGLGLSLITGFVMGPVRSYYLFRFGRVFMNIEKLGFIGKLLSVITFMLFLISLVFIIF